VHPLLRSARRGIKGLLHPAIAPAAIRAFRVRAAACDDLEAALDLAYSFDFARIRILPAQVRSEIAAFLELMAARAPKVVLEIGTANGGSLFLFTRIAAPEAHILSLDLPGGQFGGGYPAWKSGLYRSFARAGQEIILLRGDSHEEAVAERVCERLGNERIDLLFIDGDHRYEGVRRDFQMYVPMVRLGGIVAFHDIVPGSEEAVGGVPRFWRELKPTIAGAEIVADWDQGGYGIGYAVLRT
jgi:predicted O-methyltransferase YrrM